MGRALVRQGSQGHRHQCCFMSQRSITAFACSTWAARGACKREWVAVLNMRTAIGTPNGMQL